MIPSENDERLLPILDVARRCNYEVEHTHQVTRLALELFDELVALHKLGKKERTWLEYGAILHDIGWCEGQKGHHKTSLRIILSAKDLPFSKRERLIVGSIARYHRRAHPKKKHDHFKALKKLDRKRVVVLSAILRVVDALDWSHRRIVKKISCKIRPKKIILRCRISGSAEGEQRQVTKKGGLFEEVFERKLVLEWTKK